MALASSDLSDRLVEILNDCMLVDTEREKLEMVAEMQEILLNRDPLLLAEFLPHVLALHTDKLAAVRRAVLGVAEQAARKHEECKRALGAADAALCCVSSCGGLCVPGAALRTAPVPRARP